MHEILIHAENGMSTLTFGRIAKKGLHYGGNVIRGRGGLEVVQTEAELRVVLLQGSPTVFSAAKDA